MAPIVEEYITLNNGLKMPRLALGTWKSPPGKTKAAVIAAVKAGYRFLDCANDYDNEHVIGEALQELYAEGIVKRSDLFIQAKLWNSNHRPEHVEIDLDATLKDLQLDYIDLYLIHWPTAFKLHADKNKFPDNNGDIDFDQSDEAHFANTFNELVKIKNNGKNQLRALGVSNFNISQLEELAQRCDYVPDVHQLECHPFKTSPKMVEYCKSKNIQITAYSPLGNPGRPAGLQQGQPIIMETQQVMDLAKKHGKTAAQVLIRLALDQGFVVIPKSVTPERIVANAEVFDFQLDQAEVDTLLALNQNTHYVYADRFCGSRYYPFTKKDKVGGEYVTEYTE